MLFFTVPPLTPRRELRKRLATHREEREVKYRAYLERQRGNAATVLAWFLDACRRQHRMAQLVARYRWAVRRTQRVVRNFFACSHGRSHALGLIFDHAAAFEFERNLAVSITQMFKVCTIGRACGATHAARATHLRCCPRGASLL